MVALLNNISQLLIKFVIVLVWAGIELNFLIVVGRVLCFGFSMRIILITHWCFRCCWAVLTQSEGLFCFSPHPTSEQSGDAQEAGRGHSQDSWPQLTRGIFHTIWCHAHRRKNRGSWLGDGDCCSGMGWASISRWWTNCTVHCLFCVFYYYYCFLFLCCPIKLSLSQPMSSNFLPVLILILLVGGRSEQAAAWSSIASWG